MLNSETFGQQRQASARGPVPERQRARGNDEKGRHGGCFLYSNLCASIKLTTMLAQLRLVHYRIAYDLHFHGYHRESKSDDCLVTALSKTDAAARSASGDWA